MHIFINVGGYFENVSMFLPFFCILRNFGTFYRHIINFPESGIVFDPVSLIHYMTVKCTNIPQNAKKWQKHAVIFKISAKIYKNMQNLWKYAKNLCKLISFKSETPTPGHKR